MKIKKGRSLLSGVAFCLLLTACHQNPVLQDNDKTQAFLINAKPPETPPFVDYSNCYSVYKGDDSKKVDVDGCKILANWLAERANQLNSFNQPVSAKDFEVASIYKRFYTDPDYDFNR